MEVSRYITGNRHRVSELFRDTGSYGKWWPIKTTSDGNGDIDIVPMPLIRLRLERQDTLKRNVIDFSYVQGPLRGIGRWIIMDCRGMDYVKVTYYMRVKGILPGIDFLMLLPWFKRIHYKNIKKIMTAAEKLLSKVNRK